MDLFAEMGELTTSPRLSRPHRAQHKQFNKLQMKNMRTTNNLQFTIAIMIVAPVRTNAAFTGAIIICHSLFLGREEKHEKSTFLPYTGLIGE